MTQTSTNGTDALASPAVTSAAMYAERVEKLIALLQRVPTRKVGVRAGTVVVMPMTRRHDHPAEDALIHPESTGRNAITSKDDKRSERAHESTTNTHTSFPQ